MPSSTLFDIIDSPLHPDLGSICSELGIQRTVFTQQRKAMAKLKRSPPDFITADFFYGYGNNYAGANISNLDVLLHSVQRFASDARIIVFVEAGETAHVNKLAALFKLSSIIHLPADSGSLREALSVN